MNRTVQAINKQCYSLESHLRALEVSDTSPVPAGSRIASSTATAATSTATTATTAAAAAAAAGTGRAEVQTHGPAVEISAAELVESGAGLVDRRVLHVTEALGTTGLGVGGQTDAHDATAGSEQLVDGVFVGAEGKVADKEGVTFRAGLVTEGASTSLGAVLAAAGLVVGGTTGCVVEVDLTAVDLGVLLGFVGLGRVGGVGEFDVAESARISMLGQKRKKKIKALTHESDQSHAQS